MYLTERATKALAGQLVRGIAMFLQRRFMLGVGGLLIDTKGEKRNQGGPIQGPRI